MTVLRHLRRVAWPRTKLQCLHWLRDGLLTEDDLEALGIATPSDVRSWERAEEIRVRRKWNDLPSQRVIPREYFYDDSDSRPQQPAF